jgi:CheY-like chemotaxis protein
MAPRVTVVNDSPDFLELVRDILTDEHYATTCIDGDRPDALARIVQSRPDLLIIDLRMGTEEIHGWDIAQEVRREPSLEGLPIIVCSADVLALRALADDLSDTTRVRTLAKPFEIDELTAMIDGLLAEAAPG